MFLAGKIIELKGGLSTAMIPGGALSLGPAWIKVRKSNWGQKPT